MEEPHEPDEEHNLERNPGGGTASPSASANNDTASSAVKRGRKARRYRFACTGCKARKVKCNGTQPVCSNCRRSQTQCVWPEQVSAEGQLREARAHIQQLEASLHRQYRIQSQSQSQSFVDDGEQVELLSSTTPARNSTTSPGDHSDSAAPSTVASRPDSGTQLWFQVGVGEDGTVVYNGPMSRFHAGALEEHPIEDAVDTSPAQIETLRSQYALMDSVWMPLIAAKPDMGNTGVSTDIGIALLDIYWTWLHPLHNCVYRPSFITDLALGGPCYSEFLLMCIFGLAARHLPEDHPRFQGVGKGERFIARAKELLLEEMSATTPAIPTIQGLLILGGRQSAAGKSSEGWLYTGMAIRMMKDIGLHLDTIRLAGVEKWTPAEMETRKRLYNSAYIWDKTLSLALGRPPSLTRRPYDESEILDKFDDERPWKPIHASEIVDTFAPTPSLNTSTFCAFCLLHSITSDMMLLFSNTAKDESFGVLIEELDGRLTQWHQELLVGLRIDDPAALSQSPPPHIVSLNLMYHSLRILLRRPYLTSADLHLRKMALDTCLVHSKMIHAIYTVYTRTFPHRLMTYQVSYCIYTAATVEAQVLKTAASQNERNGAAARLSDALRVLQNEAVQTPGSGRSLDTIRRLLNSGRSSGQYSHGSQQPVCQPFSVLEGPERRSSQLAQTPADEHLLHAAYAASHTTPSVSSAHSAGMNEDGPYFAIANEVLWGDDYRHGGTDTGAGFQPDAHPWAATSSADNHARGIGFGSVWWQEAHRGVGSM